ncbi:MAG: class IV adenylate cyclase [Candidatus Heimdallarchaeota archaeon]|nr:MAG: class IV adenylate cyclase [Candidatus Heimdallarchaeota archaeon]
MGHINIEFKARSANNKKIKEILISKQAISKGIDHQIDTYFKVNSGRLKLREGSIENALIHYQRKDQKGPKQSNVALFPVDPGSSTSLKKILTHALGILVVVDKHRAIYFIENVKFHLDSVKKLGEFVEVEAIDSDGTIGIEKLHNQCHRYLEEFEIREEDLVSNSYSDLLLQKQ